MASSRTVSPDQASAVYGAMAPADELQLTIAGLSLSDDGLRAAKRMIGS